MESVSRTESRESERLGLRFMTAYYADPRLYFKRPAVTRVLRRQTAVDSDWLLSGWLSIEETVEHISCLAGLFGMSEIWSSRCVVSARRASGIGGHLRVR